MNQKKAIFFAFYITLLCVLGILPIFIPISIMDYSRINWNGADLAENVTGDDFYYNNTYLNLTQPTHLNVYDLRSKSYEYQVALATLQGLVNRENVSLFLIYRSSDLFWLDQINQTHGINYTMIDTSSYWNLFQLYNDSIDDLIIYDEDFLDSVNVATFLAGVYNCVVIHENLLSNFSALGINSVKFDLRDQFTSNIQIYEWAWNNFNQNATKKMVCNYNPINTATRDYIVAAKIFTMYLSGGPLGPPAEIELFKRILSEFPDNIPVIGWWSDPAGELGEYESVKIVSKLGKYSLAASIPDLTVFSSIKGMSLKQQSDSINASQYEIENKIYISVIVSDGDNVNYCADRLWNLWKVSNRGKVPVGITLEPAMFKIFPNCLNYYYQSATVNESFLAGPSGAGYCFVDMNPAFPQFLNQSKYAMDQADMDQVWLLNGYEGYQNQYSPEVIDAYTSEKCNFSGIFLNYHDFPAELNYVSNGVPVFQSIFVEREDELVGKLQAIRSTNPNTPIFVFIGFWAWDFTFTILNNAANQLNKDFVFLKPDHFAQLFMEYQLSEETILLNELLVFLGTGLIPFICVLGGLILITVHYKKRENKKEDGQKVDDKNEKNRKILEILKDVSNKAIFILVDVQLLLISKFLLFSTILNIIPYIILIVSVFMGINSKRYLDRLLGTKKNLIGALILFSVGSVLFIISPLLVIFVGFSIGILINHQIQNFSNFYNLDAKKKRDFIYIIVIAASIVLLCPTELYYVYLIIISIITIVFSVLGVYFVYKDGEKREFDLDFIKHWYFKGVFLGILLYLLIVPTYWPERLYFHLIWGAEFYPTRLTMSFNIATIYIGSILLIEYLKTKKSLNFDKFAKFLLISAILMCIIIPLFLSGLLIFIFINFIFIFSVLNFIVFYFDKIIMVSEKEVTTSSKRSEKGLGGFTGQCISWILIGLILAFIPPSMLLADAKELFVRVGITGINQIDWPSFFWWVIYVPTFHMFLIIPMTLILLIYGSFELLYAYIL